MPVHDSMAGGFAKVAEVVEVRHFARWSDFGSLGSQHHCLIYYLPDPPLGHCHNAAFEQGGILETTPPVEQ